MQPIVDQLAIEAIRENVLAGASVIESNRDDIVALCAEVDRRLAIAGEVPGVNTRVVQGIGMGARNAPVGPIYQQRLQLLEVFEALDLATAAIAAKEAARVPSVEPAPAEPIEE